MNYTVLLKFEGGRIDHDELSKSLQLSPRRARSRGQQVSGRDGSNAEVASSDYCSYTLTDADWNEDCFGVILSNFLNRIEKSKKLLDELSQTGTQFTLQLGLYGKTQMGETFEAATLDRLSRLNISLVIKTVLE